MTKKAIKEMSNWGREAKWNVLDIIKLNYDYEERLENSF
jgi:hypothetical protein